MRDMTGLNSQETRKFLLSRADLWGTMGSINSIQIPRLHLFHNENSSPRKCLNIVVTSDTHMQHELIGQLASDVANNPAKVRFKEINQIRDKKLLKLEQQNVLVHCGDFCEMGYEGDILGFSKWFRSIPGYQYKIIVCGNHDLGLLTRVEENRKRNIKRLLGFKVNDQAADDETQQEIVYVRDEGDCKIAYLEDMGIEIEGVKIHGIHYRFMKRMEKMETYPECDILISHVPPFG
jgi:hypothetical protein